MRLTSTNTIAPTFHLQWKEHADAAGSTLMAHVAVVERSDGMLDVLVGSSRLQAGSNEVPQDARLAIVDPFGSGDAARAARAVLALTKDTSSIATKLPAPTFAMQPDARLWCLSARQDPLVSAAPGHVAVSDGTRAGVAELGGSDQRLVGLVDAARALVQAVAGTGVGYPKPS